MSVDYTLLSLWRTHRHILRVQIYPKTCSFLGEIPPTRLATLLNVLHHLELFLHKTTIQTESLYHLAIKDTTGNLEEIKQVPDKGPFTPMIRQVLGRLERSSDSERRDGIPQESTLVRNGYPIIPLCHQNHPSPFHGQPDHHPDRNHPFLWTVSSNRNNTEHNYLILNDLITRFSNITVQLFTNDGQHMGMLTTHVSKAP